MTTTDINIEQVGAFAQQVADMLAGGATAALMVTGDRLGLYAALAGSSPATSVQLAEQTGTSERYVREWLAQQSAAGIVVYDSADGTFSLPPAHAAVLATDDSPASMIGAALTVTGMHRGIERLVEAFRTGEGIPWGDQDPAVFESVERFFRVSYRNSLVREWIPALDGVEHKLRSGARVADIGCGHGAALILLAQAYPKSWYVGYDVHEPSIQAATERARDAGVADQVRFELADCQDYPAEGYDLVTFFDAFHDLGDPVGAAAHARQTLAPGGTLMLVEPRSGDDLATTLATVPLAALSYAASTSTCVANSLSQPVGLALGAHAGVARLRQVLTEGGFGSVRRAAENDFNVVIEARP